MKTPFSTLAKSNHPHPADLVETPIHDNFSAILRENIPNRSKIYLYISNEYRNFAPQF